MRVPLLAVGLTCACARSEPAAVARDLPVLLDQEHSVDGVPLTSSTQSLNRYRSVLRDLSHVDVTWGSTLSLRLHDGADRSLRIEGLDPTFLTPLLPYPHEAHTDAFDRVNLWLAEYARSGVSVSHQTDNEAVGYFRAPWLPEGEEYTFSDGSVQPNPEVRPTRVQVTNNCLTTGLWELSATDSVGELYHSWIPMPDAVTLGLIRRVNGLEDEDAVLKEALAYRDDLGHVRLDLDRLRTSGPVVLDAVPQLAVMRPWGGYSTQDSRRKVQRGFARLERPDDPTFVPVQFGDLKEGDRFRLHAFVPPGVYVTAPPQIVDFDPAWSRVSVRRVTPHTTYPDQTPADAPWGHVEIEVTHADGARALVVGNLPVDLLVLQEELEVPAFGVGVHRPSELVERRMLRYAQGPRPTFAYLFDPRNGRVLNNHEAGYEQVFVRPFERDGSLWLAITVVADERIVDLLELHVPLIGELADDVRAATAAYNPPLYRIYRDDNLL